MVNAKQIHKRPMDMKKQQNVFFFFFLPLSLALSRSLIKHLNVGACSVQMMGFVFALFVLNIRFFYYFQSYFI